MNVAKLKGRMAEKGMSALKLAKKLGIDRTTLYRKMNNGGSFTIGEAQKIKDVLELTEGEASAIFFE